MIKYNKLVRDNIPEIIQNDGKECKTRILDDNEYEVMKEGVGNRAQIQARPYQLIRVILQKRT